MSQVEAQNDKKDIARGAGLNFLGFIVRLGSRLPFMLLVVAFFGAELYGRYNYIITIIEIGAAFSVFGFKRSLFKFIHDDHYSRDYSREQIVISALSVSMIVSLLVGFLIYGLVYPLSLLFNYPEMMAGLRFLLPIIIAISAVDVLLSATRINRQMKYDVNNATAT